MVLCCFILKLLKYDFCLRIYESVIVIVNYQVIWVEANKRELQTLHREKRDWIIPPKRLMENVDYTKDEYISKVSTYMEFIHYQYQELFRNIMTIFPLVKVIADKSSTAVMITVVPLFGLLISG